MYSQEQVKAGTSSATPHTYNLVLVPRRTALCDKVLEEEGVLGELAISSYNLEFIPVEDDLLSLEWDSTFKDIFLVRSDLSYSLPVFTTCLILWTVVRMEMRQPSTTRLKHF